MDATLEILLTPSPLGISASTLTSHMFVDGVKKKSNGYELDVRGVDIQHSTVNVRRELLMLVDGKFKKFPRGKAWAELQAPLLAKANKYVEANP
jgi:hypothetical protein